MSPDHARGHALPAPFRVLCSSVCVGLACSRMYACIHVCVCLEVACVRMYVCMSVCMYTCLYVCMYACVCVIRQRAEPRYGASTVFMY